MGKFSSSGARPQLGFTPATNARASLNVDTGEGAIGQAISGVGGAIAGVANQANKRAKAKRAFEDAIELKRVKMEDTRSGITSSALITEAAKQNQAFANESTDSMAIKKDLEARLEAVNAERSKLNFSPDAQLLDDTRFASKSSIAVSDSLITETKIDADKTRTAILDNVIQQQRDGKQQDQIDAEANFNNNKSLFANADIAYRTAIETGDKLRNQDAVNDQRAEAGITPNIVANRMLEERELRKTGKGSPELESLTGEDLVEIGNFAERESREKLDAETKQTGIDIVTKYWDNELQSSDLDVAVKKGTLSSGGLDKWLGRLNSPTSLVTNPTANAQAHQAVIDVSRGVLTFDEGLTKLMDISPELNATDGKQRLADLQTGFAKAQSEKVNEWIKNGRSILSPQFRDTQSIDAFISSFTGEAAEKQKRQFDAETKLREQYNIALNDWFAGESRRSGDVPVSLRDIRDFALELRNSYQERSRNLDIDTLESSISEETSSQLAKPRITAEPLPVEAVGDIPELPTTEDGKAAEIRQLQEELKRRNG